MRPSLFFFLFLHFLIFFTFLFFVLFFFIFIFFIFKTAIRTAYINCSGSSGNGQRRYPSGKCAAWKQHDIYLACWKLRRLDEVKSVSLQGDIVITGDLFLFFFVNLGGERSMEKGKRMEGEVIGLWKQMIVAA